MVRLPGRSRSLLRGAERLVRAGLLAVLAIGLRRRDPGAVVNAVLALAGSFVPGVVERRFDVALHPWQRLYAELAMLTHAVGMLGPYDDCWWWDHLTHLQSSTLVGGGVYAAVRRRGADPFRPVIGAVVGLGLLWEVLEYLSHAASRRVGLDPVLVSYGKTDTLFDLVFDLVGALVVLRFGETFLENLHATGEDDDACEGGESA